MLFNEPEKIMPSGFCLHNDRRFDFSKAEDNFTSYATRHENCAFVALLYGDSFEFLVCALLLGDSLSRLCPQIAKRVLMVDESSRFAHEEVAQALAIFWQLEFVEPITISNATLSQRHAIVFTKLHLFSIQVECILFLDLDVLVRSERIAELFDLPGPAGMFHGRSPEVLLHGQLIDDDCFGMRNDGSLCACINAGVMRIDLPPSARKREVLRTRLLEHAKDIKASQATMLPEQYFLVQHLKGWRHVYPAWNWEVGPRVELCESDIRVYDECEWGTMEMDEIIVLHFSGNRYPPWRYLDLPSAAVEAEVRARLSWRDPGHRVAKAVFEWCEALENFSKRVHANSDLSCVSQVLRDAIEKLSAEGPQKRNWSSGWCDVCYRVVPENIHVSDYGWLCSACTLYAHNFGNRLAWENLAGYWLDYYCEEQDVVQFLACPRAGTFWVRFRDWQGELARDEETVVIRWDGDANEEYTLVGTVMGQAIRWNNGSVWVHIASTLRT